MVAQETVVYSLFCKYFNVNVVAQYITNNLTYYSSSLIFT